MNFLHKHPLKNHFLWLAGGSASWTGTMLNSRRKIDYRTGLSCKRYGMYIHHFSAEARGNYWSWTNRKRYFIQSKSWTGPIETSLFRSSQAEFDEQDDWSWNDDTDSGGW